VHRDVKPSNVIFVSGVPKLADIGLVAGVNEARSFVGTEGYIPPEGPGTPSADCYSLGKLLYELSSGHDRTEWPEPPIDLATRPDRERLLELNAILHKACAPELKQRYGDAEEMRAELALLRSGQSVKGKRTMERRWATTKKAAMLAGILFFLAWGASFLVRRFSDGYLHSTDAVNELVEDGNIALRSGTVERLGYARECFKKASAIDPEFVPAYFGLLRVFMAGNDNFSKEFSSELRSTTQKLIELAPSLAESRIATAYTKWFENRWQEGLADAKQATRMRAGSKEARGIAYDFYGCYLVNLGQIESASEQYQLAARIFPTEPVIEQHLGFPYFLKRDFAQALKHFRQATGKEPRYEGGHVWAGRVYEETGEFKKAIEEFEEADRLSGQDRGTAYYDNLRAAVDHNGGKGYWNQRLEEASRGPHLSAYNAAVCLARLGKTDEAYKRLEEAEQKQQVGTGNLVFDLCWDWHDERFKEIARKNGLAVH
jgi:tetratricopeptide (TPR) repeat protein